MKANLRGFAVTSAFIWMCACRTVVPAESDFLASPGSDEMPLRTQEPVTYFDAHTHVAGILPYEAYFDLGAYAMSLGQLRGTPEQRLRLLGRLVAYHDGNLPFSNRYAPGTKAALACAKGLLTRSASDAEVTSLLDKLLTATPWTNFDSAYAIRNSFEKMLLEPSFGGLSATIVDFRKAGGICENVNDDSECLEKAVATAVLVELMRARISYAEFSVSAIGGWAQGRLVKAYRDVISYLRGAGPNEYFRKLVAKVQADRTMMIPDVKWILMTHTSELAAVNETDYLDYAAVQDGADFSTDQACVTKRGIARTITDPQFESAFMSQIATIPDIIGVDTAGPESTCFTGGQRGLGARNYKTLIKAVYKAAKQRCEGRGDICSGKLLVHTHVGEGAPNTSLGESTAQLAAAPTLASLTGDAAAYCAVFQRFPTVRVDARGQYLHYVQARRNIDVLIEAIREVRQEIARESKTDDFDRFVIIRLGHATHVSAAQAKAMADLNITADVNLTSNLSTGSLIPQDLKSLTPADFVSQPGRLRPSGARQLLEEKGVPVARMFEGHGLKNLLACGVLTVLGTDGGGIEHSTFESKEYEIASELVGTWFPGKESGLYQNQPRHIQSIRSAEPTAFRRPGLDMSQCGS